MDTAPTEIYTRSLVGGVRCVKGTGLTRIKGDEGLAGAYRITDPSLELPEGLDAAGLSRTGDSDDDLESCRIVAVLARLEGYDAILSPSAALRGAKNLNLYIDGRADHLRLMDGPDRVPLNY